MRRGLALMVAMVVLMALLALALSACGGQEANKKSEGGGSAATNGQIAFRRWLDPEHTKAALFAMNPDGSHVHQITRPPGAGGTTSRCGLPMGRGWPSSARGSTRA